MLGKEAVYQKALGWIPRAHRVKGVLVAVVMPRSDASGALSAQAAACGTRKSPTSGEEPVR